MNVILGIEIPENYAELDDDALTALAADLRTAALAAAEGDVTPDVLADIKAARAQADTYKGELAERAEAAAALEADLEAELTALRSEVEAPEAEAEGEAEAPAEPEAAEVEAPEPEMVAASLRPAPVVRAGSLTAAAPAAPVTEPAPRRSVAEMLPLGHMHAAAGVNGHGAGSEFASITDLADALMSRFSDIAGGGSEKMTVARIAGAFSADQTLTEDRIANFDKFGGRDPLAPSAVEAVTAAMCAPVEPYYGLGCMSSTVRPVRGSMASYRAPRGGVSVYPNPLLADIDNGVGIWTRADDANPSAVTAACATIPCSSPVQYDIYGVYRCMTIKNLLQMTFPELVEAFLNRLAALQARLAEETLLDAMVGSANTYSLTAPNTAYGASIDLWATIIRAVSVYREQERYGSEQLEFRAPRWIRDSVKIDLVRQKRTSGTLSDRLPTDADVDSALRDLGLTPTWTLDYAANWTQVPTQPDADPLVNLPNTFDFHLTPVGNFRVLDEGNLNIGVTNNVVRDNTSNSRNEFTMFFENFEGLIDFGCRSYHVSIEGVCPNGAQPADVTALTCPEPSA